jgi:hypothetical protein
MMVQLSSSSQGRTTIASRSIRPPTTSAASTAHKRGGVMKYRIDREELSESNPSSPLGSGKSRVSLHLASLDLGQRHLQRSNREATFART